MSFESENKVVSAENASATLLTELESTELESTELESTELEPSNSQRPILVIDDHVDSLFYAQQATEVLGYTAIVLESGKQVIDIVVSHRPFVILLDICLRDTNGFDVLKTLRQNPLTADIPVVAVTALVSNATKAKVQEAGFNEFLAKPYMLGELETTLSRYVQDRLEDSYSSDSAKLN